MSFNDDYPDFSEVEHHIRLAAQVSMEPIERHSHDIAMMYLAASRKLADLEPYSVNKVNILFSQMGRVGSKIESHVLLARRYDSKTHSPMTVSG